MNGVIPKRSEAAGSEPRTQFYSDNLNFITKTIQSRRAGER